MRSMTNPPRWAELLLKRMLHPSRREDVIGDLREEFFEGALPRMGWARARFWYVRQVTSFIPYSAKKEPFMAKILMFASLVTLVCAGWLGLMEALLRHDGFVGRMAIAASIAAISAATILARLLHAGYRVERWLWIGAAALIAIGAQAFIRNARSAHFEGFVFVISLLLLFNGTLMLVTLGRASSQSLQPAPKL